MMCVRMFFISNLDQLAISNLDFKKAPKYISLCKHREIYTGVFFVATQLNNPRLLGGVR